MFIEQLIDLAPSPSSTPSPPPTPPPSYQSTQMIDAITILFDHICRDLTAGQPSLLNLQLLCVLSRVSKFLIIQVIRTWQARLCALTQNANVTSAIQTAHPLILHRTWFQLQRFNFSLDSMSQGYDLLRKATLANCPELLELLLDALKLENLNGSNMRYGDGTWGTTLLINSATRGQKEIVGLLLRARVDLEARNTLQQTALMSVVYALINPPKPPAKSTFYSMAQYGYHWFNRQKERVEDRKHCMRALIKAKANVNVSNHENGTPLLMDVAAVGQRDTLQALIEARANPNASNQTGYTALMYTAHHKSTRVTKILLEAHANVNIHARAGSTALSKAAQNGRSTIVQELIKARAKIEDVDREGSTAFMHAVYRGHLKAMNVLITAGANIHVYNKQGYTALTHAAYHGNFSVVRLLIFARANVRSRTTDGKTPIKLATSRGHMEIAGFLQRVEQGACDIRKIDIPELREDSSGSEDEQEP